jgi:hypothetical protein
MRRNRFGQRVGVASSFLFLSKNLKKQKFTICLFK